MDTESSCIQKELKSYDNPACEQNADPEESGRCDVEVQCELLEDKKAKRKQFYLVDPEERKGLLTRIYGIIIVQNFFYLPLLAGSLYFLSDLSTQSVASVTATMYLVLLCVSTGLHWIRTFRRKSPFNYVALVFITLMEGFYEAMYALSTGSYWSMLRPLVLALGLGLIIIFTKQDEYKLTQLIGFCIMMFSLGIYLLIAYLANSNAMWLISIRMLFTCWYLIYDMNWMLRGRDKSSLESDEYVYGAVNIYSDFPILIWSLSKQLVFNNVFDFTKYLRNSYRTEVC